MITLVDGPASGVKLGCRRAPMFLRVVRDEATGAWDACDQLEDCPRSGEVIYVYVLAEEPSRAFVCVRGRGGGGGLHEIARYQIGPEQPEAEVMRNNRRWAEWCQAGERVLPEWWRARA